MFFNDTATTEIYTLSASILLSSVLISTSQANAHSANATKKEFNALKNCIINFQKETIKLDQLIKRWSNNNQGDFGTDQIPDNYENYIVQSDATPGWVYWTIDYLKC